MSGCSDVCVDMDCEAYMDIACYSEAVVMARDQWACSECGDTIKARCDYHCVRGLVDGSFYTVRTCIACHEIRHALICGSWLEGDLWEYLVDGAFPKLAEVGLYECMAELPSKAARDKLEARFNEWHEVGA